MMVQMVKNLPAMQKTRVQSLGREAPLEKGMTIHPNILAWKIPMTEEPGKLQSMESQRDRHNWASTLLQQLQLIKYCGWGIQANRKREAKSCEGLRCFFPCKLISRLTSLSWMLREENKLGLENKYSTLLTECQ